MTALMSEATIRNRMMLTEPRWIPAIENLNEFQMESVSARAHMQNAEQHFVSVLTRRNRLMAQAMVDLARVSPDPTHPHYHLAWLPIGVPDYTSAVYQLNENTEGVDVAQVYMRFAKHLPLQNVARIEPQHLAKAWSATCAFHRGFVVVNQAPLFEHLCQVAASPMGPGGIFQATGGEQLRVYMRLYGHSPFLRVYQPQGTAVDAARIGITCKNWEEGDDKPPFVTWMKFEGRDLPRASDFAAKLHRDSGQRQEKPPPGQFRLPNGFRPESLLVMPDETVLELLR